MNGRSILIFLLVLSILTTSAPRASADNIPQITFNIWEGINYSFVIPQVKKVQKLLISQKYLSSSLATGFFGKNTKEAVKSYQGAHGLDPTGSVGSLTRRMMNQEIALGKKIKTDSSLSVIASELSDKKIDEKILSIPLYEQRYPLSCEAASLRMALAYKGVIKSEDELLKEIGTSLPMIKYKNSKGEVVWGNPDEGFVGDVRGWMYTSRQGLLGATGWGVNNGPVARVANDLRPGSNAVSGETVQDIIKEISAGNPVIIWKYSSLPEKLINLKSYKSLKGKTVKFIPDHVSLVVGFRKTSSGSYTLILNDPEYGRLEMDQETFLPLWSKYNRDMVVVR